MKLILILTLGLFISLNLNSQIRNEVDTLKRDPKIDYVIAKYSHVDSFYIKYFFNDQGLNFKKIEYANGNKKRRKYYEYNEDGRLINYKIIGHTVCSGDNFEDCTFDSTTIVAEHQYTYNKNGISRIAILFEDSREEKIFTHNQDGILIRIKSKYIADENTYSFDLFNSNSSEIKENPMVLNDQEEIIRYRYRNDQEINGFYYRNGYPTGFETNKLDSSRKIISRQIFNINQDTIYIEDFEYNSNGQIKQWTFSESGLDGFGHSYDVFFVTGYKYNYDNSNRLIKKISLFKNGETISLNYYYYLK